MKVWTAALVVLLALHLALLLPAFQRFDKFIEVDSLEYYYLAEGLLKTGSYQSTQIPNSDLVRPPGYPLLILLSMVMGSIKLIPVLQTGLVFLAAALLYLTGRETGSPRVGLAAAVIYLLNPNAAFWSLSRMAETLTGFLLVGSVWAAVRWWRTQKHIWLFACGAALSAASLARPIVLPLALIIAGFLVLVSWLHSRSTKAAMPTAVAVAAGILLFVLPWQLRNLAVHGEFTISKVNESTFQNWMVAKTLAQVEGISRSDAATQIAQSPDPLRRSLEIVREYPLLFAAEQVKGVVRTLLGAEYASWAEKIGGRDIENAGMLSALVDRQNVGEFLHGLLAQLRNPWFWTAIYAMGYNVVLYGLGAAAIWKTWRRKGRGIGFLLAVLLLIASAFLVLIPLGAGESRFRAPADPLLGLLAGLAFYANTESA
jgi:4-amino-4-deoxy-L-arabinose transferase-like glycosyltransferase